MLMVLLFPQEEPIPEVNDETVDELTQKVANAALHSQLVQALIHNFDQDLEDLIQSYAPFDSSKTKWVATQKPYHFCGEANCRIPMLWTTPFCVTTARHVSIYNLCNIAHYCIKMYIS